MPTNDCAMYGIGRQIVLPERSASALSRLKVLKRFETTSASWKASNTFSKATVSCLPKEFAPIAQAEGWLLSGVTKIDAMAPATLAADDIR